VALLIEKANNGVGRVFIELGAVGLLEAAHVSSEFNRRYLHAETEPEIWNLVFPRETRRADLAFYSAFPETTGDKNACNVFEMSIDAIHQRFRIDQLQINSAILARGRVGER